MKTNNKLIILPILVIGLAIIFSFNIQSVAAADSSTIYVNSSGNDNYNGQYVDYVGGVNGPKKTIKNAVNTVNDGGTVNIANGVYYESSIDITKNMNIIGQSPDNTVIDAQHHGASIFVIQNNINLKIENLSFANGTNTNGGAISNSAGTLTISGCKFYNNHADSGGAIYNGNSGTDSLTYCSFSYNSASSCGGAIYNRVATLNLNNNNFVKNTATANNGGAIYNIEGNINIDKNSFSYNTAVVGGAIYSNSNTVSLDNSGFSSNNAGNGGAIFSSTGNLNVLNTNFSRNGAYSGAGGAIFDANNNLVVTNSNFVNNNAIREGAAIHKTGYLKVVNSGFTGNRVTQNYGGAIYHTASTIAVVDSRFNGNSAPVAGAILNVRSPMTITSSNFTSNTASGRGGAIVNTISSLTITGSYFIGNVAGAGFGGALYHSNGVLSFSNNTFSRNTAPEGGGAIYVEILGTSKIDKNIFTYNKSGRGSALYGFNGILNVSNSNFTGNSASANGGAVYDDNTGLANPRDTTFNFSKCIFHDNGRTIRWSIVQWRYNKFIVVYINQ